MGSTFNPSRLAILAPAIAGHGKAHAIEAEVLAMFDLHHASLLRYAVSFGIAVQDGEDVVQETFLALFRHLLEEKPQDNLRSWLFRVTHNLALKRRGAHRREVFEAENISLERTDPAPGPDLRGGPARDQQQQQADTGQHQDSCSHQSLHDPISQFERRAPRAAVFASIWEE